MWYIHILKYYAAKKNDGGDDDDEMMVVVSTVVAAIVVVVRIIILKNYKWKAQHRNYIFTQKNYLRLCFLPSDKMKV